jgi:hypothetical protein
MPAREKVVNRMSRIAVLILLIAAGTAVASSLRFDGVLIREGSPVYLLLEHLGEPLYHSREDVCVRRGLYGCERWQQQETWFYRYNDLNYTIRVSGGHIIDIRWSRF